MHIGKSLHVVPCCLIQSGMSVISGGSSGTSCACTALRSSVEVISASNDLLALEMDPVVCGVVDADLRDGGFLGNVESNFIFFTDSNLFFGVDSDAAYILAQVGVGSRLSEPFFSFYWHRGSISTAITANQTDCRSQ
jgi:hypothetical protein